MLPKTTQGVAIESPHAPTADSSCAVPFAMDEFAAAMPLTAASTTEPSAASTPAAARATAAEYPFKPAMMKKFAFTAAAGVVAVRWSSTNVASVRAMSRRMATAPGSLSAVPPTRSSSPAACARRLPESRDHAATPAQSASPVPDASPRAALPAVAAPPVNVSAMKETVVAVG